MAAHMFRSANWCTCKKIYSHADFFTLVISSQRQRLSSARQTAITTVGHQSGAIGPRAMSQLHSRVNPTTGQNEWVVEDSTYDFHQEIARSAYTDMLHDDERNKKYYEGIRRAIRLVQGRGQTAHVLDIGTGTGLLSMMSAESGADSIHACEAFEPIAAAAKKIVAKNGFADRIKVISRRSTEVTVGPDGDMPHRANILPAEVFDTELIGEGAIPTYLHAHRHLLQKDCICVPHSATIHAQVFQSDLVWSWHRLHPIRIAGCDDIRPTAKMATCSGAAAVHDLQLSQLTADQFQPLTPPLAVIDFNFSRGDFAERRTVTVDAGAESAGVCHGVFMWWELSMDTEGEVRLSTAPSWAHPERGDCQWRDHWMQAVYFFDKPMQVQKGEELSLTLSHDDYSLWFNISQPGHAAIQPERPICQCGAHMALSRPRIGMLNDAKRTELYTQALRQAVHSESVCVSVSDSSMLPLIAAKLGAKKVYSLEPVTQSRRVLQDIIDCNNLTDSVSLLEMRAQELPHDFFGDQKVDFLMGEPLFVFSILPWNNLHFWYARTCLASSLTEGAVILPCRAKLRGVAMEFDNLWKFHAPVGQIEGFDVRIFDELVQSSSEISDATTEPHPLWEYPGQSLTADFDLMEFDFTQLVPTNTVVQSGTIEILREGICHGIALWMEYNLGGDIWVSTGPQQPVPSPSRDLQWDRHSKQGIHFLRSNPRTERGNNLDFDVSFNPQHGSVNFQFQIR